MTFLITPETVEAGYNFLCTTPPFNKWRMPESDDVKFIVNLSHTYFGAYQWDGKQHTILVSAKNIEKPIPLIHVLAHEMLHLYLEKEGLESKRGGPNTHNSAFRKFAARICKYHGFELKTFY
jgi:hypothetical protein